MHPRTAYLLSVSVFGAAALPTGVVDVVVEGRTLGLVAVLGGLMLAIVGYNALRPESYDGPEEWGPLVYLMVAGSLLFAVGVVRESV